MFDFLEILYFIGLTSITYFVAINLFWYLRLIYVFVLSSEIDLKRYGKWAVVTGCTDGIGKAFSEHLAKRGLNIVLISRTQSKLDQLAFELRDKYNIETKVIAADFSYPAIYHAIESELSNLEIAVLVNNVGVSYEHPMYFHEVPSEDVTKLINVNSLSCARMTHMILLAMLKRNKGVIMNLGSEAGEFPTPLLSEYAATKAFIKLFTKSVAYEYRDKPDIIIQFINPCVVSTNMSKMRPSYFSPTPSAYVSGVLKTVGKLSVTSGCFQHELQHHISSYMPQFIHIRLTSKVMRIVREKVLKKKNK